MSDLIYSEAKADHVINFIEKFCVHVDGQWAGRPFLLIDWQKDLIKELFGTVDTKGLRQYREFYCEIGRKQGKALHINTPIPTPNGFVKMKDLREGDEVYSGDGNVTKITGVTEVMQRQSYLVKFSDGTTLTACGEHQWEIGAKKTGRINGTRWQGGETVNKMVRDTKWIKDHLTKGGNRRSNNCFITINHRIDCPDKDLPIDPYVLGVWLGDGTTGENSYSGNDQQIADEINATGHTAVKEPYGKYRWTIDKGKYVVHKKCRWNTFRANLDKLGILNAKRTPKEYFVASYEQRLSLLQGIMDTDGSINAKGQNIELGITDGTLANDAFILARSLGLRANHKRSTITTCQNGVSNFQTEFSISVDARTPIFRLHRKLARMRSDKLFDKTKRIYITDVIDVGIQPVKCIAVADSSHTYLAGEQYIKTHNSTLAAAIALYMLVADGEYGAQVVSVAKTREQARIIFAMASKMVRLSPALSSILEVQKYSIIYPATQSIYKCIAAEAGAAHGMNLHCAIYDELHTIEDGDMYDVLKSSMGARRQPAILSFTTAGTNRNSFCYSIHEYAEQIKKGTRYDPRFLSRIFTIDEGDDWKDPKNWYKACPSLDKTVPLAYLMDEFNRARELPSYEITFKTLYLCIWANAADYWISDDDWMACYDSSVSLDYFDGKECILGCDLSASDDLTSVVALFKEDKKTFLFPFFFLPDANIAEMAKRNKADYLNWANNGHILLTQGPTTDHEQITNWIIEFGRKVKIKTVALDVLFEGRDFARRLANENVHVTNCRTNWKVISEPCKDFEKMIRNRLLVHINNPCMRWNVNNTVLWRDANGNVRPDKMKSRNKIDGVMATVIGLYMADLLTGGDSVPFFNLDITL